MAATTDQTVEAARLKLGIVLMVAALSLAALTGALMKFLTADMTPIQISWFRFAGFLIVVLPLALLRVGRAALRPPRVNIQLLRGVLMVAGNVSFIYGAIGMDYANAIAILYVYPFLMTLFAPMVLGERVPMVAWAGVVGGFLGVLIVVRPDISGIDRHALLVLFTGLCVAAQMLLNRKLGVLVNPLVVSAWGAGTALAVLTPLIIARGGLPPVSGNTLWILVLMALTSSSSQTMMIQALRMARAADLAPYTYSELAAATLLGLVVFGTLPDMWSWLGIGLIVVCGVAVARAQGRLGMRRQPKI